MEMTLALTQNKSLARYREHRFQQDRETVPDNLYPDANQQK
jgi:hypothetical protein